MFGPECSPDGDWVAFQYNHIRAGPPGLWIVAVSEDSERLLVPNPRPVASRPYPLGWSPDGSWIYYLLSRPAAFGVYRVPVDGGDSESVMELPALVSSVAMSRDATTLATIETESTSDLWITTNFKSGN